MTLEAKIPAGPLAEKWSKHKFNLKLVNPANKRKYDVIVVGTGLAGGQLPHRWPNWVIMLKLFVSRIAPAVRTRLLHRVASMRPKITKTMATAFTACFMIP